MSDAPLAEPVRPPFSAKGKRLGVFVISYNAESLIQETLQRIPEDVWREVEALLGLRDQAQSPEVQAEIAWALGELGVGEAPEGAEP